MQSRNSFISFVTPSYYHLTWTWPFRSKTQLVVGCLLGGWCPPAQSHCGRIDNTPVEHYLGMTKLDIHHLDTKITSSQQSIRDIFLCLFVCLWRPLEGSRRNCDSVEHLLSRTSLVEKVTRTDYLLIGESGKRNHTHLEKGREREMKRLGIPIWRPLEGSPADWTGALHGTQDVPPTPDQCAELLDKVANPRET